MTGRPVVPLSQVKKVSFLADKNRFIVTLSLCTKMSFFVLSQSVPREGMHQAVKILSCPIPRPVPNFDRLSLCPAGQENSAPLESLVSGPTLSYSDTNKILVRAILFRLRKQLKFDIPNSNMCTDYELTLLYGLCWICL